MVREEDVMQNARAPTFAGRKNDAQPAIAGRAPNEEFILKEEALLGRPACLCLAADSIVWQSQTMPKVDKIEYRSISEKLADELTD